jgi:hypothetical protein
VVGYWKKKWKKGGGGGNGWDLMFAEREETWGGSGMDGRCRGGQKPFDFVL